MVMGSGTPWRYMGSETPCTLAVFTGLRVHTTLWGPEHHGVIWGPEHNIYTRPMIFMI